MSPPDEFILTEVPDDASLQGALGPALTVKADEASVRERTYLDSFDARLRAEGLTLCFERGRFELFLHAEERPEAAASDETVGSPRAVAAEQLPPGGLRERIAPILGVRALVPRARVRVRVASFAVLDDLDKTVTRVGVEAASVVLDGRRPAPLPVRMRLWGLRGYEAELAEVRGRLLEGLGARPAGATLLDDAVAVTGGTPEGVSSRVAVDDLRGGERADRAVALVLRRLLAVVEANLPGTLADLDAEFLHDLRVSVRRIRSVLREARNVFPPDALARARADFKWVQGVTGEARDLDVWVMGYAEMRELVPVGLRADLDPLLGVLRARRAAAHRAMARELRSDRFRETLDAFASLLERLVDLPAGDRPDAERSIAEVAGGRIRKVYRRMVKMGRAIDAGGPATPPEDYHELRKKGKELRYLLELFGAAAASRADGAEEVKRMTKELKALQDVLGHHQDREVQMTMLRQLADPLAAASGGPAALMVTGVLLERLEDDAAAARSAFAERFAAFAGKAQRARVREVFGGSG